MEQATTATRAEVAALILDHYQGRASPGQPHLRVKPDGSWEAWPVRSLGQDDIDRFRDAVREVQEMYPVVRN
jgi:hypothetical protein